MLCYPIELFVLYCLILGVPPVRTMVVAVLLAGVDLDFVFMVF